MVWGPMHKRDNYQSRLLFTVNECYKLSIPSSPSYSSSILLPKITMDSLYSLTTVTLNLQLASNTGIIIMN